MTDWFEKSKEILRRGSTKWGIKASLSSNDNYDRIFTRDAVMAGIVGLLLEDTVVIESFANTLKNLKQLQGDQGQIASNYAVNKGEVDKVSYGTLSPKIDSCTWYLIGVGVMLKSGNLNKDDYFESVSRTINLLQAIEYNQKHLMYIPKGGNWADEYVYDGYILYDQVLRIWALMLLADVYHRPEWNQKAHAIRKRIIADYRNDNSPYLLSSIFPGGVFDRFDLPAHVITAIAFPNDDVYVKDALNWINMNFLEKGLLPPVFDPVIDENDPEWHTLNNYHLYRFKNKPYHFHNGGIWWIWLGWLSVAYSIQEDMVALDRLYKLCQNYLSQYQNKFEFNEYISSNDYQLGGTKNLLFTASGISLIQLAHVGYDFKALFRNNISSIKESLVIRKEYFNLSEELFEIFKKEGLLSKEKIVIAIAGESGSGKSVTAKCLHTTLMKNGVSSTIIHQDGYYKYPPKENHQKRKENVNWVGVNELHLDKMQQHIDDFRSCRSEIVIPVVNYKLNQFSSTRQTIADKQILLVEGVYAFFLKNIDFKIYMSRTFHETLEKRKSRIRESYDPFVEQVLEIEHDLLSSHRSIADVVINKDYEIDEGHGANIESN